MLKLGQLLQENRIAKLLELVLVFALATGFILLFLNNNSENLLMNQ